MERGDALEGLRRDNHLGAMVLPVAQGENSLAVTKE